MGISGYGASIHYDVSNVHSGAPSHVSAACQPTPTHITQREVSKRNKYASKAREQGTQFIPVILDTYGKFGDGVGDLVDHVKQLAQAELTVSPKQLVK